MKERRMFTRWTLALLVALAWTAAATVAQQIAERERKSLQANASWSAVRVTSDTIPSAM